MPSRVVSTIFRYMNIFVEIAGSFLYRELFKRNTLRPMKRIIRGTKRPELQHKLLRQWARTKSEGSQHIQIAGGFLFTSVVSCPQWPGAQNGHWFAAMSFYSSMLFALLAILTGSQLLLLPSEKELDLDDSFDTTDTSGQGIKQIEKNYLNEVVKRLTTTKHDDRPNPILVFALQAPIMLLTLSVMSFLTGLSTVIYAPLAKQKVWDDDTNNALLFSIAGFLCICIFCVASYLVHGLFAVRLEPTYWSIKGLSEIQNIVIRGLPESSETPLDG